MRARIWGCRGSLATPGPDTVRYGGNTSCVHIDIDGPAIVLDAGTGIRPLGRTEEMQTAREIHLLLTHLHMDHLEGIGFFLPLWRPDVEFHVWGPASPVKSLAERIQRYLSPPVDLEEVPAQPIFHDAPDDEFQIGDARVVAQPIAHAGPAVGYRIEHAGGSLAYLPDHEPTHTGHLRDMDPAWISGIGLAENVDVLLHDSQYTEDEYPNHIGWGHSSVAHVVDFAKIAGARQLVMFHHDPLHDDAALDQHLGRARELWGDEGSQPILASEGMVLDPASKVFA
jgi:phosphoribosyl 1,2-cyclic phosphodiesterase